MHTHALRPGHGRSDAGRRRRLVRRLVLLAAAASLAAPAASPAQSCPTRAAALDDAKLNKLYLYFPPSDAGWFPPFDTQVSPARAFDVSQLTAFTAIPGFTGGPNHLRDAIQAVVANAYCEFNVQVLQTSLPPPGKFPLRATVAIGTDSRPSTFGQADAVDVGNARPVDFARVWAGWYQTRAGGKGGALNGARSTLERWATSIGGTAAHEAGHLYGLSHLNGSAVRPGEDALTRHLMPGGALLTDEQRAGYRRHFNDTEFSILAANVGLAVQTQHTWALINPNQKPAAQLRIDFLSRRSPVTLAEWLDGSRSPWSAPTISGGTQVVNSAAFHGYRRFQITWSTPKAWSGAVPGQVPPGGQFVVGASFSGADFNGPDPIIVTDITLFGANGAALPLAPRLPGYDTGTLDAKDGSFDVGFFNLGSGADALVLTDVQVFQLPRVLSLDAMLPGEPMRSWTGEPIVPWPARDSARSRGGSPWTEPQWRYGPGDALRDPARPPGGSPRLPESPGRFAFGEPLQDPVRRRLGSPRFPESRERFTFGNTLRDSVQPFGGLPRFPRSRGRFTLDDTVQTPVLPFGGWPRSPEPWGGFAFGDTWPDPVRPLRGSLRIPERRGGFPSGGVVRVPVARLAEGRHIFENVVTHNCGAPADRSSDSEVNECVNGIFVDLFPATTVYIMATVVDPHARHWDPARERFVVGPVESRIFFQFAGHHPDLNRNGTDDAIDIFRGTSRDRNHDGVPDDARRDRRGLLLILLLLGAAVWGGVALTRHDG